MKKYFFYFFFSTYLFAGVYYEVDIYGNIRSSGTLTVGKKIISPEIEVDTITYSVSQVKNIYASTISVYNLDIKNRIFNSSSNVIIVDTNLTSNYTFTCSNLNSPIVRNSYLYTDNLYKNYSDRIYLRSPLDLLQQDILSFVVENIVSFPSNPRAGRLVFYNGGIYWWDGAEWRNVQSAVTDTDQYIKKLYPILVLQHRDNNNGIDYTGLEIQTNYDGAYISLSKYHQSAQRVLEFRADNFIFNGSSVTVLNLNSIYGITSSTAYVAGMTFYDEKIDGNQIIIKGSLSSSLQSGYNSSLKVYSDIDIIPATGYKTNVYSNLNLQSNNILNVNNLETNSITANNSITASSMTAEEIYTQFVYYPSGYVAVKGEYGSSIASMDNSTFLKVYKNSDIAIQPASGYTLNLFISSTTTAGTLAGYITIKVNNQTYKVPIYNP